MHQKCNIHNVPANHSKTYRGTVDRTIEILVPQKKYLKNKITKLENVKESWEKVKNSSNRRSK